MKKTFISAVLLCGILLICSCSPKTDRTIVPGNSEPQKNDSEDQGQGQPINADDDTIKYETVDVDLASMSGTVAYSQVFDMINHPSNYEGKIVKMQGLFSVFYSSETKQYYPAVKIPDATACCEQGIEFVLYGNPSYPSGYPETNKEITVVGKFEIYYEGATRYCHLVNTVIV